MEKKTILALLLSILVIVVWSFVFEPKQKQAPSKRRDPFKRGKTILSEPSEKAVPDVQIPQEGEQAEDKNLVPKTEEKEIVVETPLYRAVLSNAGPTIKSFKLKKYYLSTDPDSSLIEMVQLKENRDDFFKLDFQRQANPENKRIVYNSSEASIHLSPESSPRDVAFNAMISDGFSINQIFRIYPDKYHIDLIVTLSNNSEQQVAGNLRAILKTLPPEKKSGYYSFVGVVLLLKGKIEKIGSKDLRKEDQFVSGPIDWMAYEEDYFMSALIPDDQSKGDFRGQFQPSGVLEAVYESPPVSLQNNERISSAFTLYLGPRDLGILKQLGKNLDLALNFGWTDIIAKPLLYSLRFLNQYVKNYGVAIILLTILIKILFWPLTHKSYKSMKEMQKLQPHMAKIREKHKGNKEQMNRELMALYKTYKVNPMGGCLPMVIQIPVFFALFRILGNSIELRHAPFMLWVNDLSAPDRLFNFPFQIPFMSPPYGIPVLTLLMGVSMFIQQKLTPTTGDPTQAKVMMFLPIIFTVMFINFPSGLVLYWLVNNILSIGQQYRIKKG
jgi:YidC/Oxa1 family membrane protein insertase